MFLVGPLDPALILRSAQSDPMWAVRGRAIQEYATLEQSLFSLFQLLTDMEPRACGTVFFKIASTQARNAILDKLIRIKFKDKCALFWNPFLKDLRPIDTKRNEIVHWNTIIESRLDENGSQVNSAKLRPPNFWVYTSSTEYIKTGDMLDFIVKCDIYARLCNMFSFALNENVDEKSRRPWLEIYQRPLTYPLPADHPLCTP
jgi:hypothetical protein